MLALLLPFQISWHVSAKKSGERGEILRVDNGEKFVKAVYREKKMKLKPRQIVSLESVAKSRAVLAPLAICVQRRWPSLEAISCCVHTGLTQNSNPVQHVMLVKTLNARASISHAKSKDEHHFLGSPMIEAQGARKL